MPDSKQRRRPTVGRSGNGIMLNRAVWLGKGERSTVTVIEPAEIEPPPAELEPQIEEQHQEPIAEPPATPVIEEQSEEITEEKTNFTAKEENALALPLVPPAVEPEKVFSLAVEPDAGSEEKAAPYPPMPAASETWPLIDAPVEIHGEEVIIHQGDRRYRARPLDKNLSDQALRVNLLVSRKNGRGETTFHVDTFDLCAARQRTVFMKQASEELGVKEDVIRHDLGHVFLQLEALRDEQIKKTLQPEEKETGMSEEERAEALRLLRDPRLLDRILEGFAQCGVVGEETNKKVAYLGTVSRLLKKPLAIVMQSSSSAGKSSLMEAVLDFVPEDQRESYTAMTGQSALPARLHGFAGTIGLVPLFAATKSRRHNLPLLTQCCSNNTIPAQANLKAIKARIPSATPFFCFTNANETTNTEKAIRNRSRPLGNERAKETAKQYRALNAANTPKILSRRESAPLSLMDTHQHFATP